MTARESADLGAALGGRGEPNERRLLNIPRQIDRRGQDRRGGSLGGIGDEDLHEQLLRIVLDPRVDGAADGELDPFVVSS
jgi:hypothetical protein